MDIIKRIWSSLLLAAFAPTMAAAAPDRFAVPATVSPAAAKALAVFYRAMRNGGKPTKPRSLADWDARRANAEAATTALGKAQLDRLEVSKVADRLGGVRVLRIRPQGWHPTGRTLVYMHGGGYVTFSAASTAVMAATVATATGDEVISIDYTLAPRGNWQTVTDEVVAVWRALLARKVRPESVGFFGDSAGGGLAAGSILKIRERNLPLPGALVLLSPWSDITMTGDTYDTLGSLDPILDQQELGWAAEAYADVADQRNPFVSPVYGDYAKSFPATLIQVGTREMFLSDAVRQYQAIRDGGHDAILDVYEGLPHVFQYFIGDAPENLVSRRRIVDFFRAHLRPGSRKA